MACGSEMRLMQVVHDNTMMVSGYEHQTLQCLGCNEIERRFVFARASEPAEPIPLRALNLPAMEGGVWTRALARLARRAATR
jgi:hypothetical protein